MRPSTKSSGAEWPVHPPPTHSWLSVCMRVWKGVSCWPAGWNTYTSSSSASCHQIQLNLSDGWLDTGTSLRNTEEQGTVPTHIWFVTEWIRITCSSPRGLILSPRHFSAIWRGTAWGQRMVGFQLSVMAMWPIYMTGSMKVWTSRRLLNAQRICLLEG